MASMDPPAYGKHNKVDIQPPDEAALYQSPGQTGVYPPPGPYGYSGPSGYPTPGQHGYSGPSGYSGQPVAYHPQQGQHTVVIQQPPPPQVADDSNTTCLLVLGIFTTFCCNLFCGIPAIILAVMAMGTSDPSSRRSQASCSMTLSIIAIVSGVITYIVIVALYFAVWIAIVDPYSSDYGQ